MAFILMIVIIFIIKHPPFLPYIIDLPRSGSLFPL
jgi:hypothetical protein